MADRNILRIAPSRGGVQIANAWRFWSQGDEFYAAARNTAALGKISFHRNGNWQHRAATGMSRLSPGLRLSAGWLHVLELVYLIGADTLLPLDQREEAVILVDTPSFHKLLLDLLLSDSSRQSHSGPPPEMRGTVLKTLRLRSGKILLVIGRVMPFTSEDQAAIADMRAKLRINFSASPNANEVYAEASLHSFQQGAGNIVQVIPIGSESLAVEGSAK